MVHHFPITPEMREDVTKNGVPLYADGGPVPPLRPLNPQLAALREQMAQQSALNKAYDEAMKNVRTSQMPTFADWVASQGKAKGGVAHMAEGGSDDDYRGSHQAPGPDYGAQMHDVSSNGMYPKDFYSTNGLRYYADANDPTDRDAYYKIAKVKGKPNEMVSIHRAIPTSVYNEALKKEAPLKHMIRKGDWVAINKEYAKLHGDAVLKGNYKIASMRVPAKHVWTNADSIHEWGYHPEEKKAAGGSIKPVGYTKERITVSPNLDAMRYELESVKHFTKKVK
jgi:hypothetical protein